MNDKQILERFNPNDTKPLSPEELEVMRNLSDDQIQKLAEAYPNTPSRRAYIKLYDKNIKELHKQMFQLSTWQNLRNLRKYSNQKNLVAWDFKGFPQQVVRPVSQQRTAQQKVIVDMSAQEAAAELKETIKKSVTKIENVPKKATKETKESMKAAVNEKLKSAVKSSPAKNKNVPADQQFDDGQ